ncbi:hypothetical protein EON64_00065 [archaeon]|nr:MAG: hypothetical protein EON64_00065 [archaeon]
MRPARGAPGIQQPRQGERQPGQDAGRAGASRSGCPGGRRLPAVRLGGHPRRGYTAGGGGRGGGGRALEALVPYPYASAQPLCS